MTRTRLYAAAVSAVLGASMTACSSDGSSSATSPSATLAASAVASESPSEGQGGPASWPGSLDVHRAAYLADLQVINASFSDSDLDAGLLTCADVAAGKAAKAVQDAAVARLTRAGLELTDANGKAIVTATVRWVCPELGAG